MKLIHECPRRNSPGSWQLGFLTAMVASLFAAIHAWAEDLPPAAGPQRAIEQYAAPAAVPAPPAAVAGVGNHEKPATAVIAYTVDDAVAKIREDGFDESTARDMLEMSVRSTISPATSALAPPPLANQPVDPQRILWVKGRMVVQTTDAGHRRVGGTLEAVRKYGAAEVLVEVRFVSLDAKALRDMLPDETASPVETPEPAADDTACVQSAVFDRPLAGREGRQVAQAKYLVERDPLLRYRVMDKAEGEKWLAHCRRDARSNVLQAPRVTAFNGQTVTIMDASQRPFVVGVKKVNQGHVPQIRVVSEGTTLQLRPVADRSRTIYLDFASTFSNIQEVETLTFRDDSSAEMTIQRPEVATLQLEGRVELKSGQWVLLAGPSAGNLANQGEPAPSSWKDWLPGGGKPPKAAPARSLVVMLRAEKLPLPRPAASQTE